MARPPSAAARGVARKSAHSGRLACAIERLEWRKLLSVSQTADGWTSITPPGDAHVIYVSSSAGNDQNSGLSELSPVRTLSHGISLLRAKAADQLLLARGDAWDESLGIWERSGLDQDQPMVIGAYGTGDRPLLRTGDNAFRIHSGGGVSHVALVGLHLQHTGANRADGLSITGAADDLLVEDCLIEQYQNNIVAEASHGPVSDIRIRRSVIVDSHNYAFPDRMNSEGAFFEAVQSLKLEENVFDHNGWAVPSDATIYNHNVYIRSTCTDVEARGNLFANAASHGLQARSGGIIENNVFLNNPIGLSFGLVNNSPVTPGGVTGRVKDNVFIGGGSINGDERGNGVEVANIRPQGASPEPVSIYNNLFTHGKIASSNSAAITVGSGFSMTNTWDAVGINDLYVKDNKVYNWGVGLEILKGLHTGLDVATGKANHEWNLAHPNDPQRDDKWPWSLSNLQVLNNDFQQIHSYLVQHDAPIDRIVPVTPKPIIFADNKYDGTGTVPFTTLKSLLSDVRVDLTRVDWERRVEKGSFTQVGYPDPERSVGSYHASLGSAGTTEAFLAAARQQSRLKWRVTLTAAALRDYLFDGFGMNPSVRVDITSDQPDSVVPPPLTCTPHVPLHVWAQGHKLKLSVTYSGGAGIDRNTIDLQDVVVSSAATSSIAPATAVTIVDEGAGAFTATYTFDSPSGKWRKADVGAFTLSLDPDQVKDIHAAAVSLDTPVSFNLHVGRSPKPAVVKKARLRTGSDGVQRLTIKFSTDVQTVAPADLIVTPQGGTDQPLDPALFQVAYDNSTHVATYTFAGLPNGQLGTGGFNFTLTASGVLDVWQRPLDGNHDGVPGGDWVWNVKL